MSREQEPRYSASVSRTELFHRARNHLAGREAEHPVHDLVNIDSPAFGSSDLVLTNPSRTRLHIARFGLNREIHEYFLESVAFGRWLRDMLGVSARLFRTTTSFTLYVFAPRFPETAQQLVAPVSGLFQMELVPYAVVPVNGRPDPVVHILNSSTESHARFEDEPPPYPANVLEQRGPAEPPPGMTAEEMAEFARLERLFFSR